MRFTLIRECGSVAIPTGLNHSAQGWPRSGLPWVTVPTHFQPQRGCINSGGAVIQPFQGCDPVAVHTQGSSCLATLG